MSKAKKKPKSHFYSGEEADREQETEDIYNTKERDEMLEDDEITAAEEGFMIGREQEPSKKQTRKDAIGHTDEIANELAKEEAEED